MNKQNIIPILLVIAAVSIATKAHGYLMEERGDMYVYLKQNDSHSIKINV